MTVADLVLIIRNRLSTLWQQRAHAVATGDLDRVVGLDADISETEATLAQLQTL